MTTVVLTALAVMRRRTTLHAPRIAPMSRVLGMPPYARTVTTFSYGGSRRFGVHAGTDRCTIVAGNATSFSAMAVLTRDRRREGMTRLGRNVTGEVDTPVPA